MSVIEKDEFHSVEIKFDKDGKPLNSLINYYNKYPECRMTSGIGCLFWIIFISFLVYMFLKGIIYYV